MKLFVIFLASMASAQGYKQGSPMSKVLEMLSDLQGKVTKEGEAAQKAFDEFSAWCEDRSKNIDFEVKSAKGEVADLKAQIEKESSTISSLSTKIEELSGSIASNEADLKAATDIRNDESKNFKAEEKDLVDVIGTLEKAIGILEKEMRKGSASMMQLKSAKSMVDALSALVDASLISSADSTRLTALVQSSQEAQDNEDQLGAPSTAVYEHSASGSIIDTLDDLRTKAEAQLEKTRRTEQTNSHNYQLLKQSLSDEIAYANSDMAAVKKSMAASEEGKATAAGDLGVTQKDLDEDTATLASLHQDCMTGAEDFQLETKSRGDELKALATARKVLEENAGGAAEQTYSFLQVDSRSSLSTGADLANFEAVRFVRDLARKEKSAELAQLASRMATVMKFAKSGSGDPLAKVKGLVADMIERLEAEAQKDASRQAYCDSQTSEANAKKAEKQTLIDKLSTNFDSMSANSAKLKEEIATLQKELAELASSQAQMIKIRSDGKAAYTSNHAEMKQGVEAVQKALSVLKDYYASDENSGAKQAGSDIIELLEDVESHFSKGLAEMEATESMAVTEFEKVSKENDVARRMKTQDVSYKTKEAAGLAKSSSETSSDLEGTHAELDAIMEYLSKLDNMCVAKAEPYAEKKARRESELAGLKEALSILEGEAVLVQQTSKRTRTLRGRH